jgi:ketosteroid isomerase-like protein
VSRPELDVLRAAYDAWNRADLTRFVESFTEDVEVHPFLGRGLVASTYHGHDGLRSWYADANEPWERLDVEAEEFQELDDGRVAVFVRATGEGIGSRALVEARIVHVIGFRDGRIARLDGYANREMALQALGLAQLGDAADDG